MVEAPGKPQRGSGKRASSFGLMANRARRPRRGNGARDTQPPAYPVRPPRRHGSGTMDCT